MKKLYIILSILLSFTFYTCNDTTIGDTDVDFEIEASTEATGYVGKPIPLTYEVLRTDKSNFYPMEVKITSKKGKITATDSVRLTNDIFQSLSSDVFKLNYTPTEQGEDDLILTFRNKLVQKNAVVKVNVKDNLYSVIAQNQPERSLIDTPFDFDLLIKEAESTGADSITTFAKVVKGTGKVFNGEIQLNNDDEKAKSRLVVGGNKISYTGNIEGENVVRFFFVNKWGNELTKDVSLNISLPLWELSNSMGKDPIEIPYNDKYSFNLSVDEEDIFKDNSYTASFRVLSNSDLKLSVNDKEYNQGAEFKLKAGGNVGLLTVNDATTGAIEFIVKDKYKQENKDTVYFVSKLPLKPIEASLDKSSQSVKINQVALFKMSLSEVNYSNVFSVKYEVLSGEGTFEGGNEQSLSEGTHDVKFTPTKQGTSTFKITITDTNKQEKILNATVQSVLSPLVINLSETALELIQGNSKGIKLTASEPEYTGKYFFTYKTASADVLVVNGTSVGVGGRVEFTVNEIPIIVSAKNLGVTDYTITVSDEYQQSKDIVLKATVKGEIKVKAQAGGSVTGGGIFTLNQSATVKATPSSGNQFTGWYAGERQVSLNASHTFLVIESLELEARFKKSDFTLTVNAEAGGTAIGGGAYKHGEEAILKATANTGFGFDGWYEGATKVSSSLEYKIAVISNKTIVAKFTAQSYKLTVNAETGGTATGSGTYKHGETVSLKATVNTGYSFIGWFINGKSVSGVLEYNFTLKEETLVEARFTAYDYGLTVNAGTGGTATGGGNFKHGSNVSVKATPDANHTFKGWSDGTKTVSTSATYNFVIEAKITLEAQFTAKKFLLTVNAQTGGTATGAGSFDYGTKATVTATANTGFGFDGWYIGSTRVSTTASYEITIDKAITVEARFIGNKFNISASAGAGGTVTGAGQYEFGKTATLTATASANYSFKNWTENGTAVSTNATLSFSVSKDRELVANFTGNKFNVTANAQAGGTATGSGAYDFGSKAKVTATVDANYTFAGWHDGTKIISTSLSYEFTVSANITLEAQFTAGKFTVTVNAGAGGTATGSGSFNFDSNVTVKATPDANHTFKGWSDGTKTVSTSAEYTFILKSSTTLGAEFTAKKYQLTVNAGAGGTATGAGSFDYGTKATVTATANTGYGFDGWYIGSTRVSTTASYEITIDKAITVEARFIGNKFNISASAGAGGTVTGAGQYEFGKTATLTATASANYSFKNWTENGTAVSTNATLSFSVSKDRELVANFTGNKFNVTANAQAGGTATGSGAYDFGSKAKVTATVDANYTFAGWHDGTKIISTSLSYEFTVSANITLEAQFTAGKFTVTVNAGAGGTATGSGSFNFNSNVTVKATPDANHTFKGWSDGTKTVSTSAEYTFILKSSTTLGAEFTAKKYQLTVNAGAGGTATGAGSFDYGTKATVTATANTGYGFDGWYIGSTRVSTTASYQITIDKVITVEARFTANKFNIAVSAETGGTAIGGGSIAYGTNATLTATPIANYTFVGWYEGVTQVSPNATYTFKVDKARTLVAKFKGNPFNVTANAQTGGTATGGGSFAFGSKAKVTATVDANYTFTGWYEGATNVSNSLSYEFTVTKATTLEARFIAKKYNVTVNALAGGTATGSGSFDYNSNVTVKAVLGIGHTFGGWYNGATKVSSSLDYTFVLKTALVLEARFVANTHSIVVNAGTGGTAIGGGSYKYGVNATLTATAGAGHKFLGWYVGGSSVATTATYTFKVEKDLNVEARFEANKFNIVANAETGGTATGGGSIAYGTNTTLKATPNTNYQFDGWYEGATKVSTNLSYTFTVDKARTLVAKFVINKHKITLTGTNGVQAGAGDYNYGVNATVTATASANYKFLGWYIGTTLASSNATYIFKVEKDLILEAKYELIKYVISASATAGGTVTGGATYNHGASVSLVATPSTGYKFLGWYEGATSVSTTATYTFSATKARTLQARFELLKYVISASATAGGTVTGGGLHNHGASVSLVATPLTGHKFLGWYEGATQVSTNATYTFSADKARTLQARFEILKYVISASATAGGTVTGGATYNHGVSVSLKATANADYKFLGWYEGSTNVTTNLTYTFNVDKARTLQARFEVSAYLITANTQVGGTVTGGGKYNVGANVSLKAIPKTGNAFLGWYESGTQVSTNAIYTFTVDKARTLEARYSPILYYKMEHVTFLRPTDPLVCNGIQYHRYTAVGMRFSFYTKNESGVVVPFPFTSDFKFSFTYSAYELSNCSFYKRTVPVEFSVNTYLMSSVENKSLISSSLGKNTMLGIHDKYNPTYKPEVTGFKPINQVPNGYVLVEDK